jgi:hypothetical protein
MGFRCDLAKVWIEGYVEFAGRVSIQMTLDPTRHAAVIAELLAINQEQLIAEAAADTSRNDVTLLT